MCLESISGDRKSGRGAWTLSERSHEEAVEVWGGGPLYVLLAEGENLHIIVKTAEIKNALNDFS